MVIMIGIDLVIFDFLLYVVKVTRRELYFLGDFGYGVALELVFGITLYRQFVFAPGFCFLAFTFVEISTRSSIEFTEISVVFVLHDIIPVFCVTT